jgi:serine protease Do
MTLVKPTPMNEAECSAKVEEKKYMSEDSWLRTIQPARGVRLGRPRRLGALSLGAILALGLAMPFAPAAAQGRTAPDTFADLVDKLSPAVVNISTTQKQVAGRRTVPEGFPQLPPGSPFEEFFKDFFERQQRNGPPRSIMSLGSGFVVDPKGYVVTNHHVIDEADEVKVILNDNSEHPAKVVGRDPKTDLAVVKIETNRPLTAARWGDSDQLRVGDWVLAIGNPFGLGGSVTAGIVSARGRNIRAGPYDDFIQTDASINKGNSGGPLFDTQGMVVGVATAIFSQSGGSIGIGFAVPSALAKPVVAQLIQFGRTKRGWLGVKIQTVTDEIAESLGLDKGRGALVAGVSEGSPAAKANIEPGDVIVSFDGKAVNNMNQLPRLVAETPIGKEVPIEVWRKGRTLPMRVAVGELEEREEVAAAGQDKAPEGLPLRAKTIEPLGLKVAAINDEARQLFDLAEDATGVVVTEVLGEGPASQKDVRPGDVILEVGQNEVKTPDQVLARVKEAREGKRRSVLLLIQRSGDLRFVAIPLKT